MKIRRIIMSLAMIVAVTSGALAQSQTEQNKDLDSLYAQKLLKAGTEAPDFSSSEPDDKTFRLSQLKGKYILLDFWASWCPDCRKDIPVVRDMHKKYSGKVQFVGVSFDVDHKRWTDCLEKNEMKWTHVSELKKMRESDVAKLYGVQWIPSMTLVGPDGKVVLSTVVIERMEKALSEIK